MHRLIILLKALKKMENKISSIKKYQMNSIICDKTTTRCWNTLLTISFLFAAPMRMRNGEEFSLKDSNADHDGFYQHCSNRKQCTHDKSKFSLFVIDMLHGKLTHFFFVRKLIIEIIQISSKSCHFILKIWEIYFLKQVGGLNEMSKFQMTL